MGSSLGGSHLPRYQCLGESGQVSITQWWELRLAQGGSVAARGRFAFGAVVFIGKPQAGSLNDSPLVSTAQAMRAFFAAMATTAFQ